MGMGGGGARTLRAHGSTQEAGSTSDWASAKRMLHAASHSHALRAAHAHTLETRGPARSTKRRIALLDGPCLGAGAAMALNHWHPDAAIAFSQHLETQVRAFLSRVCLTAVSHGGVCGGARVSQCGVCQTGGGGGSYA